MLTFDLLAPGLTLLGAVALSVCSFCANRLCGSWLPGARP